MSYTTNNNNRDGLLFIGTDSDYNLHYISIPDIFLPYKDALSQAINNTFFNSFTIIVPPSFIKDMTERDVLHKFIYKHTLAIFNSIETKDELDVLIEKECRKMFDIKKDDDNFKEIYKYYKKEASVVFYASNFYKRKLLEYKARLEAVEL